MKVRWIVLFCGGALLPLLWIHPVLGEPATRILGVPAGDNVTNVWNCWWMRYALSTPSADFFYCPLIFVPWGTSLVLHTHTALPAFVGATLLAPLPVAAAQNVLIWAALAANTAAMFALAWQRTRDPYAASAAALTFAGSPFITAHLLGHWNLIHLWSLPLIALWFPRALARHRWWRYALLTGSVLTAAAYTDYYVTVYGLVLVLGLAVDRVASGTIAVRPQAGIQGPGPTPAIRRPSVVVPAVLAATCFLAAAVIVMSGGFDMNFGSLHVSAHTSTNPLRLGWISALLAGIAAMRPRITFGWRREHMAGAVRSLALTSAVVLIGALPLLWRAADLVASADYAAPTYAWRSGPRGVDLLTAALGHPYHVLWGASVRLAYRQFDLDPIEQVAWMGIGPLMLSAYAIRHPRVNAGRWTVLAVMAFTWALGPFLRVGGADTGLPLPQVFQQFIPLLSNARIPGRAMALVTLSLAMLVALGTAQLRQSLRGRPATVAGSVVCLAILLEFWPVAHPTLQLRVPEIYSALSNLGSGALLEVPLGIRDGFGAQGRLDHEALFHQTSHGRPIFGGFVARLSPRVGRLYSTEPVLSSLLTLSSGETLTAADLARDRAIATARLHQWRVRAVVVRKEEASAELVRYVREILGVRLIAEDDKRQLYLAGGGDRRH